MFSKKEPLISVCIPVFHTEEYLENCLNSILLQDIKNLEVIIVNDGSKEKTSNKRDCKTIVKDFKKKSTFSVKYIEHEKNKGLVEARRSAIYEAKGKYIFILDSDDSLVPNGLKILLNTAEEFDADIVQAKANTVAVQSNLEKIDDQEDFEKIREKIFHTVNKVYEGCIKEREILDYWLIEQKYTAFLWGKLIKREVYLNAFEHIPPIFCTYSEETIQYLFIAYFSHLYVGINDVVYNYSINTGITSRTVIKDIKRWEQVCTTASVFTAIFNELENMPKDSFSLKEIEALKKVCCTMLMNNIYQLENTVVPEIKEQAYLLLCDYWGESFVNKMKIEFNKNK